MSRRSNNKKSLVVRFTCTCGVIFEYENPNPYSDIRLVTSDYYPHCPNWKKHNWYNKYTVQLEEDDTNPRVKIVGRWK